MQESIQKHVRLNDEEEGEEEVVSAVESIIERGLMHCLMMSSGECPGLRGLGWMILVSICETGTDRSLTVEAKERNLVI